MRFDLHQFPAADLHVASAGDPTKPLILMLHGFPEYWAAWKEVIEELASDFYVVAPDQRGYNLSGKPSESMAFKGRHLANDIAVLADRLSPGKPFILAGHDWGASIAYAYAFTHPRRLSHLIVANGVHPLCFQRAIFDDPAQRQASQYINRLREPDMAMRLVENDFARLERMFSGFSQTSWMTPEMRRGYQEAWGRQGAMEAMLNWYRASPILVPEEGAPVPESSILDWPDDGFMVRMPHLLIWGDDDVALRPSCFAGLERFASDLTVKHIAGTGHWLLHEKPGEVAEAIRDFVSTAG